MKRIGPVLEKAKSDYRGDVSKVLGLCRSTVARKKDKRHTPTNVGYRDFTYNLTMSNKHVCEMQVNTQHLAEVTEVALAAATGDPQRQLAALRECREIEAACRRRARSQPGRAGRSLGLAVQRPQRGVLPSRRLGSSGCWRRASRRRRSRLPADDAPALRAQPVSASE